MALLYLQLIGNCDERENIKSGLGIGAFKMKKITLFFYFTLFQQVFNIWLMLSIIYFKKEENNSCCVRSFAMIMYHCNIDF